MSKRINERLKRAFQDCRKYAGRLSQKSLDRELSALERFDVWNGRKSTEQEFNSIIEGFA
jgi:hypothetical protein